MLMLLWKILVVCAVAGFPRLLSAQNTSASSGLRPQLINTDTAAVLRFVALLQQAVQRNDSQAVADLVNYPLHAWDGTQSRTIRSAAELMRRYSTVFSPDLRRSVAAVTIDSLFSNYQGVMFDNGRVWFYPGGEGRLKITRINPPGNRTKLK